MENNFGKYDRQKNGWKAVQTFQPQKGETEQRLLFAGHREKVTFRCGIQVGDGAVAVKGQIKIALRDGQAIAVDDLQLQGFQRRTARQRGGKVKAVGGADHQIVVLIPCQGAAE